MQGAVNKWLQALPAFDLTAAIQNNIAGAPLRVPDVSIQKILASLAMAFSVIAYRPHDPNSFLLCAKLAEHLHWVQHARDCVDRGLQLDDKNAKLLRLRDELKHAHSEF